MTASALDSTRRVRKKGSHAASTASVAPIGFDKHYSHGGFRPISAALRGLCECFSTVFDDIQRRLSWYKTLLIC